MDTDSGLENSFDDSVESEVNIQQITNDIITSPTTTDTTSYTSLFWPFQLQSITLSIPKDYQTSSSTWTSTSSIMSTTSTTTPSNNLVPRQKFDARPYPSSRKLRFHDNNDLLHKNHKKFNSKTPMQRENEKKLRSASLTTNTEMLKTLLNLGTNPNCSDCLSRSCLHLAASRGFIDVIKILLEHGADPNAQDSVGNTPLHLAVCSASSKNCNEVVRLLLKYGSNVHSLDRKGKNPLDLAQSKLKLMRSRRQNFNYLAPNLDENRRFSAMINVTNDLIRAYLREHAKIDEMNVLENGVQNLSTNPTKYTTYDVDSEADQLLDKIDKMGIRGQ